MNFSKSFEVSHEMRNILPVHKNHYAMKKPTKNFLMENIKSLREMQRQMVAAKVAMEEQAKKSQMRKKRSTLKVTKENDKAAWVRVQYNNPSSDESTKSNDSSRPEWNEKTSMFTSKQLIDRGVQTSPLKNARIPEEEEISSENERISQETDKSSTTTPDSGVLSDIKEKAISKILKNTGINFVELNMHIENKRKINKEKSDTLGLPPNYQLGALPRYLKNLKKNHLNDSKKAQELSLENQRKTHNGLINDEVRPGYIQLTDEERLNHLHMMNECYQELLLQLNQLPVSNDSLKAKRRRAELEKQLDSLEKSIKLFSKERLYIEL